jgi:hypothetical protein
MALTNRLSLAFTTYGGLACKIVVLVGAAVVDPSGAAVAAIRSAIDVVSTTLGYKASIGVKADVADTPANGDYEDVEDKMALTFGDENGMTHTYYIPSPLSTCFLATDNNTVDPANASVAALIAGILTHGRTQGGNDLTTFKGGTRVRKKNKRRS